MEPSRYYMEPGVAEEIVEWLKGRWAAVYFEFGTWLRWRDGTPLTIKSPDDIARLAEGGARSFYGTIEVFRSLEYAYDVEEGYASNVLGASSFIDIDILDEEHVQEAWRHAIRAATLLASWLDRRAPGSVYLLWSGAGVHVRVCWKPLAREAERRGVDPVWLSFVVAEHAIRKNLEELRSIVDSSGLVKVENVVARKRVFTAPLSLHKRLEMAAVAFQPDRARDFTLDWALPGNPRHDPEAWRGALKGSVRELVEDALTRLGAGAPARSVVAPRRPGTPQARRRLSRPRSRVGRFPVMALLQAARYYVLNRDLEKAKSFGLNRAIFYAWAKYYGPAKSAARRLALAPPRGAPTYGRYRATSYTLQRVPGMREEAPVSPGGWYMMGGVEQRPEDFDRHVARRFEEAGIPFEEAWRAAVEYVSRFPPHILRDPRLFFERVYLPVRDSFERLLEEEPVRPIRALSERRTRPTSPARHGREQRKQRTLLDWLNGDNMESRNA